MAATVVTDRREGLQKSLTDALTRHLDEPQVGDVKDLCACLVATERVAQGSGHVLAVGLDLHVDEVDDDDAARWRH